MEMLHQEGLGKLRASKDTFLAYFTGWRGGHVMIVCDVLHIKGMHRKIKDKKCDMCDKSFILRGHLKRHKEIVCMGIRYNCDFCNKAFTSKEHMRRHMSSEYHA